MQPKAFIMPAMGLSPRTRGSHGRGRVPARQAGPIPADAGEPRGRTAGRCSVGAYPRGRGGAHVLHEGLGAGEGLSPRTRGSRVPRCGAARAEGPIPADAGEPCGPTPSISALRAYPRGRGGAGHGLQHVEAEAGLSPRTRGSRGDGADGANAVGPIPADAGEPDYPHRRHHRPWAYPRGRGGARMRARRRGGRGGLSPRTRGSPLGEPGQPAGEGPIPADAGEPSTSAATASPSRAYPRGRGGARIPAHGRSSMTGLSPRTRGSLRSWAFTGRPWGPIPADAGEPDRHWRLGHRDRAYPRGRGGARRLVERRNRGEGLSPRTRGSQRHRRLEQLAQGPIPADAGEPCVSRCVRRFPGAYPRGRGGAAASSGRGEN